MLVFPKTSKDVKTYMKQRNSGCISSHNISLHKVAFLATAKNGTSFETDAGSLARSKFAELRNSKVCTSNPQGFAPAAFVIRGDKVCSLLALAMQLAAASITMRVVVCIIL